MNSRSLLSSSVGAVLSICIVCSAEANAPVAQPVELVSVCDAYGAGYFFVPGTDNCIRLSGFVRSTYRSILQNGFDPAFWAQDARLNLEARSETDFGTLRALYRLEGGRSNVDSNIDMDVALISLAGFRAGFVGANYWSSNHGNYGSNPESPNLNITNILRPDYEYGFDDATIFDYTWAINNGISITVGIEDPRLSLGGDGLGNATNNGGTAGVVNFYAGINWSNELGTAAFTAVHDSLAREVTSSGVSAKRGGWAYKVSAGLNLNEIVPGGYIQGWYMMDGDYNTDYVHAALQLENPTEIYGAAFLANLTDEVELETSFWRANGGFGTLRGFSGLTVDEGRADQFNVGFNWLPSQAPGLELSATFFAGSIENSTSAALATSLGLNGGITTVFPFEGIELSVTRSF